MDYFLALSNLYRYKYFIRKYGFKVLEQERAVDFELVLEKGRFFSGFLVCQSDFTLPDEKPEQNPGVWR